VRVQYYIYTHTRYIIWIQTGSKVRAGARAVVFIRPSWVPKINMHIGSGDLQWPLLMHSSCDPLTVYGGCRPTLIIHGLVLQMSLGVRFYYIFKSTFEFKRNVKTVASHHMLQRQWGNVVSNFFFFITTCSWYHRGKHYTDLFGKRSIGTSKSLCFVTGV